MTNQDKVEKTKEKLTLKEKVEGLAMIYVTASMDEDFERSNKAIDKLLSLIDEEKGEAVDKAFDWIWAGWNLDLGNIDRAKQQYKALVTNL